MDDLIERLKDIRHLTQGDGLAALIETANEAAARLAEVEAERDVYKVALERITKFNFDFLEAFHLSARECREVARAALGAKP